MLMRAAKLFCLLGSVTALLSCETAQNIAPTITQIENPPDGTAYNQSGLVVLSRARIDPKGWGYADPYFSYAATPEAVYGPAATVVEPTCVASGSSALNCHVNFKAPIVTHYFQWHLDFGKSAADVATWSRPEPPPTFTIKFVHLNQPPPPPCGTPNTPPCALPPPPPNLGSLVLYEPSQGQLCVGTFHGWSAGTVVQLKWRGQNTAEGQAMPGDYQVVVEHAGGANCASVPGLNLNQPNAAFADAQYGCYVIRDNMNDTATPGLAPNRQFRWRVRRILEGGQFEPFTPPSTFLTGFPNCDP